MFKILSIFTTVFLFGCASKPAQTYQPVDMANFIASCSNANYQIDFLQKAIDDYTEYHREVPVTLEDQRYYGKLKNNIWLIRSTCPQKFR